MPSGVLPHYSSCLLTWWLIINHAYWYCRTLGRHCNQHFTSQVYMEEGWLQVWCYLHRGAIISDMSDDPVPLSGMPACRMQLYQTYMLGS